MLFRILVLPFFCCLMTSLAYKEPLYYELVQVLFHHGLNVPEQSEICKTDPYDALFRKMGYGSLTNVGKQSMYNFGRELRSRYYSLIGNSTMDEFQARSIDMDRSKMSLKYVLAGLHCQSNCNWHNENLESFPITYEHSDLDFLRIPTHCPVFGSYLKHVETWDKYTERKTKWWSTDAYYWFYGRMESKAKITTNRLFSPALVYHSLRASLNLGLSLPEWCPWEDFRNLFFIKAHSIDAMVETVFQKRMGAGFTIEEFLKNIANDEEKRNEDEKKKKRNKDKKKKKRNEGENQEENKEEKEDQGKDENKEEKEEDQGKDENKEEKEEKDEENEEEKKMKKTKKMYLYSGSDYNVALFCRAHMFQGLKEVPFPGDAIIIEKLRDSNNEKFIRAIYYNGYFSSKWIWNCGSPCTYKKYLTVVNYLLPSDNERKCIAAKRNYTYYQVKPTISSLLADSDRNSFKYPSSYWQNL